MVHNCPGLKQLLDDGEVTAIRPKTQRRPSVIRRVLIRALLQKIPDGVGTSMVYGSSQEVFLVLALHKMAKEAGRMGMEGKEEGIECRKDGGEGRKEGRKDVKEGNKKGRKEDREKKEDRQGKEGR
jgi:hypothetical protein